ncbi:hypothetical protein Q8G35_12600 [Peribacillus simplex]|uniref:Uncharacterized protein n=2 Tax=Peribacillus TaxID=2675229 RepID=A0AA90SKS0_9BACI|nr:MULTISPECIES: hypothetical protein [Peribacillus]MDP1419251.1 hypothetical protein [Peribacillus simplex]MDP1452111.1 hypothetical protein [Peribacillus frigoritolerans]
MKKRIKYTVDQSGVVHLIKKFIERMIYKWEMDLSRSSASVLICCALSRLMELNQ